MTSAVIDAGDGLPLTIPALVHARARERGDDVMLVCDDDTLTYADARRRSARLACGLLAAGAGHGTRIGLLMPNGSDLAVGWLAAARIGAICVPLSTFSTGVELIGLLRGADVSMLFATPAYRSHDYVADLEANVASLDLTAPPPLLDEAVPSLRRIAFTDGATAARAEMDRGWTVADLVAAADSVGDDVLRAAEASVCASDRMVIVHTSGSTSEPKGVIHTHGALIRHLDNLNRMRRYEPGEVLFSNSPFFWIGGFAYCLVGTLVAGAKLVCSNSADASAVLDVIERERPTMVNGFAASVSHLPHDPTFASRDLSSIRRGNLFPIMPDDVRPADPELRHSMLGMTEAGSVCLASDDESEQPETRRGSFGRPVPGFEAEVRADDGTVCSPGEVGVLWFRGPFLMEGYDGRERHETFDTDGWFRTGDLVSVDEDGFFYFHGRSSDMIKTAGANVSPREVEAAILEVCGLVAHVVGVDDDERGQIVGAVIRADRAAEVDLDELRAGLRERLSSYKVPRRFVVVRDESVPILSSGKLDLRALGEMLREG